MYIDRNIERLQNNLYHWISPAENISPKYNYITTIDGKDYFENIDGGIIEINKVFDETQKGIPLMRQMVIAFGISSRSELNKLYKTLNDTSVLLIIEPNPELFSYALNNEDLNVFEKSNVVLFVDNNLDNLQPFFLDILGEFNYFSLVNNMAFYLNSFYRQNDGKMIKEIIQKIRQIVRARIQIIGNSIEDGLDGLENNLKNIEYLIESKNPAEIYKKFKNKPAIVISAGPSLEKNIQDLREAKGKAILIAVDTILTKLLNQGVIPDFVCSVERIEKVYDYFYKGKNIPKEVTLVGPTVLDPRIFSELKGNWILPFRTEVSESNWLQAMTKTNGNVGLLMGASCAHVAFGFAVHLGASPIILVGQDLAYGTDFENTHVSDTIYDKLEKQKVKIEELDETEGYYGGIVKTTKVWMMFKQWFEIKILEFNLNVINATEGGAKIANTQQFPLKEALFQYCKDDLESVYEYVKSMGTYGISVEDLIESIDSEINYFNEIMKEARTSYLEVEKIEISAQNLTKHVRTIQNVTDVFNEFVIKTTKHPLISHNIQGFVLKTSWDLSAIDDVISVKNLAAKKAVQIKYYIVIISTCEKIIDLLQETVKLLEVKMNS
ncbi:6-hydroxymethylpterin diphosphokinase MptE-like protein [Solibacillus sp. FSL R7-0668]|uniref:motility associated factor glycosyltransferase family protein n=1 Tax=Solibacillus sp. FSL R7-0668 TaxID=2921688 RepID=UPI0030F7C33C